MADQTDLDPLSPAPRARGRVRPLLGLACALPLLVAAVGFLAISEPPTGGLGEVSHAESVAHPGAAELFCPGPLQPPAGALDAGPDSDLAVTPPSPSVDVTALALEPASSVLFGTVSGSSTLQEDDGSVRAPTLSATAADGTAVGGDSLSADLGIGVLAQEGVAAATSVQAETSEGGRPVAAAVQSTMTAAGDYRSLSVTECARTATSASFLGLDTSTGSSSALVLRNPTTRPATASVQVWTPQGAAAMAGRSQVVVPAGEEETILLESIAPGHAEVGVQVDVLGAPLAMHAQVTRRDGLAPGGAELRTSQTGAATSLVMPGVEFATPGATLLLANPEGGDTAAAVRVLGADGEISGAAVDDVEVPAGTVVALPLEGVPAGIHSVQVEAESPILAVARAEVAGADLPGETIGTPVDMTLVDAVPAIENSAVAALPAGGAYGFLEIAATADTAVTVIPLAADGTAGSPLELELTAQTTTALNDPQLQIDGEPAAGISIVPQEPGAVHATWLQRVSDGAGGVLLSALPIRPAMLGGNDITVRLAGDDAP